MKYKIGIYGSAAGDYQQFVSIAEAIGRQLGEHADKVIVITGACTGLPYAAAKEAAAKGAEVWGYASSLDLEALQTEYPNDDIGIYSKIIYVPPEFSFSVNDRVRKKYRNVISTANCDAAVIISGQWGTLNEFTNLIDFQKTVAVLTGTGGIADELPGLAQKIRKPGQGEIIFNDDEEQLIKQLLDKLKS